MDEALPGTVRLTNTRVVAIDGGTATGKGRLIEELSQLMRLKGIPVVHLSTGSAFRAIAYVAIEEILLKLPVRGTSESQRLQAAIAILRKMDDHEMLRLAVAHDVSMHGGVVWIDGKPASEEMLKGPGCGTGSSIVSIPVRVREFVTVMARRQINEFDGFALIDGRDTTHTIVPEAAIKLLLTVAPHQAAARSKEHTMEEIVARDEGDRKKVYGALRHPNDPGQGVRVMATDDHTPESLRDTVYRLMRRQFPELPPL